jgi:hypothetical protein
VAGVFLAMVVVTVASLFWLLEQDRPVAASMSFAVSLLTSAIAVFGLLLRGARGALGAAARVLEAEDPALVAAQETVDEQRQRVRGYERRIQALRRPEPASLYRFIGERYTSSDYREHLGVVALVQRDFEALSRLLVGHPDQQPPRSLPQIDRIVLYVDDLDRCPPARVVQVLRAVHLLLAFPLFVVVVAVDSRWLERSLRRQYAAILTASDGDPDPREAADYWASTPQNYLEKIFQISYWVRPMDSSAFASLVRSLLDQAPLGHAEPDGPLRAGVDAPAGYRTPPGTENEDASAPVHHRMPPSPPGPMVEGDGEKPAAASVDLTPRTLHITEEEGRSIEALAPLISTPRGAKRLVNLYRLLKVSAGDKGAAVLEGEGGAVGQHEAALLLLAINVGFPGQAATLLRSLQDTRVRTWPAFVDELRPQPWEDPAAAEARSGALGLLTAPQALPWRRLCSALDAVGDSLTLIDIEQYRTWLNVVGRFSFGTVRTLASP